MSEDMKDLFGNAVSTVETDAKSEFGKVEIAVAEAVDKVKEEVKAVAGEVVAEVEKVYEEAKNLVEEGVTYAKDMFHHETPPVNMNTTLNVVANADLSTVVESTGTANGSAS